MDNQDNQQGQITETKSKRTGNFLFALICVIIAAALMICAYSIIFKLCFTDSVFKDYSAKSFKYITSKDWQIEKAHMSPTGKFKYEGVSSGDNVKAETVSGQLALIKSFLSKKAYYEEINIDNAEVIIISNSSKIDGGRIRGTVATIMAANQVVVEKIIITNSSVELRLQNTGIKFTDINAKIVRAKKIYRGTVSFTAMQKNDIVSATVDFEFNAETGEFQILKISDVEKAPALFIELIAALYE